MNFDIGILIILGGIIILVILLMVLVVFYGIDVGKILVVNMVV